MYNKSKLIKTVFITVVAYTVLSIIYISSIAEINTLEHTDVDSCVYTEEEDQRVSNNAFAVGERLEYSLQYGFIKAGTAVLEVKDTTIVGGRECFLVTSEAKTNPTFSLFFKVHDIVKTYIDAKKLYTWRFEKYLREGSYKKDVVVIYDQVNHTVRYPDGTVLEVPPNVQDALSSLYYLRTKELIVGESVFIDNHADKKNYPLEIKVLRQETIETPAGIFDCLVVEPILQASGIFQHKGRLTVWLSNDQLKLPIQMKSKIIIGSISAILQAYHLP